MHTYIHTYMHIYIHTHMMAPKSVNGDLKISSRLDDAHFHPSLSYSTRPIKIDLLFNSLFRLFVPSLNGPIVSLSLPPRNRVTMVQEHLEISEFRLSQVASTVSVKAAQQKVRYLPLRSNSLIYASLLYSHI